MLLLLQIFEHCDILEEFIAAEVGYSFFFWGGGGEIQFYCLHFIIFN